MGVVVSFTDYTPAARFDGHAWSSIQIEEAAAAIGPWTVIDTIAISPTDTDPTDPASRSFTTENGTGDELWYRVTFLDASSDTSQPTTPIQNVDVSAFASVDELFRILKVRTPSADQRAAGETDLLVAATEIRHEIDAVNGDIDLTDGQLQICHDVNLDRAADLWRHRESAPGSALLGDDIPSTTPGRYSWERYAQRLAPCKQQWGLA